MKLNRNQIYFLDGLLDAFDDFPDGAWQVACESAIQNCAEFKRHDPYDVWIAWVKENAISAEGADDAGD